MKHSLPIHWRRRLADFGVLAGILIALAPLAMKAYGRWDQKRLLREFNEPTVPVFAPATPPRDFTVAAAGETKPAPVSTVTKRKPLAATAAKQAPRARRPRVVHDRWTPPVPVRDTLPRRKWVPAMVQIPSIGVEAVVAPGKGNWRRIPGPAFEPNSAGPGGAGNAIIASHRNMWDATFAQLPKVHKGDSIYVVTQDRRYRYVVAWSGVVSTRDDKPLRNTRHPVLTLYTCVLPFRADRRFVVRARLVEMQALAQPRKPLPRTAS